MTAKVRTCLWFNGDGGEAAAFYVTLLPGSRIESQFSPTDGAPPLVVDFTLGGTPYQALNGGPDHPHSWAASISVLTQDQAETDRLWAALLANGGMESRCGWLKDRFGLFWQIVPEVLPRLLASPDKAVSARVMQAMMGMVKIDISGIEAAARGA
jgi:predicted 3-demethylubiquinone-9 3-methyltransferase (glyoxalase superfamily)